jgi:hypothetical protein
MKTLKLAFAILLMAGFSTAALAQNQNQKTETFKVWGKCGMCKTRIENTVKGAGAENATWDLKTQMLTVSYDPSKTDRDALSKKLASVGHDTEKYKAPDNVYEKLPACCHYTRAK